MNRRSTWLPGHDHNRPENDGTSAPDAAASTVRVAHARVADTRVAHTQAPATGAERSKRGGGRRRVVTGAAVDPTKGSRTPLWLRAVFVAAFALAILLGQWWALAPGTGDSMARPGRVPSALVLLALVLFVPVVLQVSSRVPMVVAGLALLALVPAQWLLAGAVEQTYHNDVMHRSAGATVTATTVLPSGPSRVTVRLADGRTVNALFTLPGKRDFSLWRPRSGWLQPGRYGPFVAPRVGQVQDVLVDPNGHSPVVDADRSDTTAAGRGHALLWLGGAALGWAPFVALALSALLRRRSYWGTPEDQIAELR